jgi:hypothetical protein
MCFGKGSAATTARPGRRGRKAPKQARPEKARPEARPEKARPEGRGRRGAAKKALQRRSAASEGAAQRARHQKARKRPRRRGQTGAARETRGAAKEGAASGGAAQEGAATQARPKKARPEARPRGAAQKQPRATGDPDAELEELSRAGRVRRSMRTSKRSAERDATQNSRSPDVRQDEPKTKHTHKATHTLRHPRRRPEEVRRARESKALGPDADLEEAGRGRPDPPRRRPRGGQQCFGEGSAAPTARPGRRGQKGARRGQRRSAAGAARKGAARGGAAKRRGQRSAWPEAHGWKRMAWRGQEARPNQPRATGDPAAELEELSRAGRVQRSMQTSRRPAERTRRRTRGVQPCARTSPNQSKHPTQHTQQDTPDADLKRSVVRGSQRRSAPTPTSKRQVVGDPTHQDADLEEDSSALAREARHQRRGQEGAAERRQPQPKARRGRRSQRRKTGSAQHQRMAGSAWLEARVGVAQPNGPHAHLAGATRRRRTRRAQPSPRRRRRRTRGAQPCARSRRGQKRRTGSSQCKRMAGSAWQDAQAGAAPLTGQHAHLAGATRRRRTRRAQPSPRRRRRRARGAQSCAKSEGADAELEELSRAPNSSPNCETTRKGTGLNSLFNGLALGIKTSPDADLQRSAADVGLKRPDAKASLRLKRRGPHKAY